LFRACYLFRTSAPWLGHPDDIPAFWLYFSRYQYAVSLSLCRHFLQYNHRLTSVYTCCWRGAL
jgi:hypothetical protein